MINNTLADLLSLREIPINRHFFLHRSFSGQVHDRWGFDWRTNEDFHLIFCNSGGGEYHIKEGNSITVIPFSPGRFIFLSPGITHRAIKFKKEKPMISPIRFGLYQRQDYKVVVDIDHEYAYLPDQSRPQSLIQSIGGVYWEMLLPQDVIRSPYYLVRKSSDEIWPLIFRKLTNYFHKRTEEDHYSELIDQWLRTLILGLAALPEKRIESGSMQKKLEKAIRIIDESAVLLSLPELSASAGLSPKYFGKMFSLEFGIPPQTYMRKKILARSLPLLSDTDMTLEEIASELGYGDSYSYSKAFRKFYGISPGKVRK